MMLAMRGLRRTIDYGGQPTPRSRVMVLCLVAACTAPPMVFLVAAHELEAAARTRAQARGLTRSFIHSGKACGEISEAAHRLRRRPLRYTFQYGGVSFARRFGHADCRMISLYEPGGGDGYPACRFTGPAVLRVTAAGGPPRIFDVGVGRPAAVFVRDGQPHCRLTQRRP